jgi:hypothetical protein
MLKEPIFLERVQLLKHPDDFSVAELRGGTMHIALNDKTGINASFCPNGASTVHRNSQIDECALLHVIKLKPFIL